MLYVLIVIHTLTRIEIMECPNINCLKGISYYNATSSPLRRCTYVLFLSLPNGKLTSFSYRLSKEREPDLVQYNTKPRSVSIVATQVHQTILRASRSHEDFLSPFNPNPEPKTTTPSNPVDPTSSIVVTDTEQPQIKTRTLPNTNRRGAGGPALVLDIKGLKHQHPNSRVHSSPAEGSAHLLSPDSILEGRGVVTVSPGFKRKFTRGHKKASSLGTKYDHAHIPRVCALLSPPDVVV